MSRQRLTGAAGPPMSDGHHAHAEEDAVPVARGGRDRVPLRRFPPPAAALARPTAGGGAPSQPRPRAAAVPGRCIGAPVGGAAPGRAGHDRPGAAAAERFARVNVQDPNRTASKRTWDPCGA